MSWIDRLNDVVLEITTGDGQTFTPLWLNAQKNVNYNTEGFDFVGVDGSYVSRKEQSGDQFPVTLYFQGESCIEDAEAFEESAKDKRPWKVKHPFFDNITVQPLSLQFDYSEYNVVKITGVLWKTLLNKYPEEADDVADAIVSRKTSLDTAAISYSAIAIPDPDAGLLTPLGLAVESLERDFAQIAQAANATKELKDSVRAASGAIQGIFTNLTAFTESLVQLINFPFIIGANVEGSIDGFLTSFESLTSILDINDSEQSVFAEIAITVLASAAAAQFINPSAEDYQTRSEVVQAENALTELYDNILNYYDNNGYVQDAGLALSLDTIINIARAGLFDVAFQAKQERTVILGKDSDPVNLAHTYFGRGDDALDQFVRINQLALNEYFEIKKGRSIIYFV